MNKLSVTIVIVLGVIIGVGGCGKGEKAESVKQIQQQRPQDMLGDRYRFSEKDFQKEIMSAELFYVPDGKDDGMIKVRPNLRNIPELLREAPYISEGFCPRTEGSNEGRIYLVDSDASSCRVAHVGDNWVVAQAPRTRYRGFIYTRDDDVYVTGQELRKGYYVLVGVQKVPLANGSSESMFAFVRLDSESERLAFEAHEYNDEVESAAGRENVVRDIRRTKCSLTNELAKLAANFEVPTLAAQIHLPSSLQKENSIFDFEKEDAIQGWWEKKLTRRELEETVKSGQIEKLFGRAYSFSGVTPSEQAACALERCYTGRRYLYLKKEYTKDAMRSYKVYAFSRVDNDKRDGEVLTCYGTVIGTYFEVDLWMDVYIIEEDDSELISLSNDKKAFIAAFEKKYGKGN